MQRDTLPAAAFFIALATLTLSGCGADDGSSASGSTVSNVSSTPARDASATQPDRAASPAGGAFGASAGLPGDPALAASNLIVENMQASLAADSQQVAPVLHYAPGDDTTNN